MTSLNRITIHWTAGNYVPNAVDKKHYHFLVDNVGKVFNGVYKPEDNINCKDGKYAAHCGGGNTGNIGVAMCGMYDSRFPITRKQLEATCKLVAELSKKYGIAINSKSILTHAEFGRANPHTTSYGKIDINKLPCVAVYGVKECGDHIRKTVNWYRSKM